MERISILDRYFELIQQYPHLFKNEDGGIGVITNRDDIEKSQKELYLRADVLSQPRWWYDLGVVAEDAWVVVLRDLVKRGDGTYGPYIRMMNRRSQVERSGKDVVILTRVKGKFLFIRHFRHDDRAWHWECPRGFGESGLSAEDNAAKELREETGLHTVSLQRMDRNQERVAYFLADCVCDGDFASNDVDEAIGDTALLDTETLEKWIADCRIDDMYTLRALCLAYTQKLIE